MTAGSPQQLERIGKPPQLADGRTIPLSPAVQAQGLLFVSGQLGLDDQGALIAADATAQTQQTLHRIEQILKQAGSELSRIVKATIWITDKADFPAVNQVWAEKLGAFPPARSTVVSELLIPGAKIEIEVVALAA